MSDYISIAESENIRRVFTGSEIVLYNELFAKERQIRLYKKARAQLIELVRKHTHDVKAGVASLQAQQVTSLAIVDIYNKNDINNNGEASAERVRKRGPTVTIGSVAISFNLPENFPDADFDMLPIPREPDEIPRKLTFAERLRGWTFELRQSQNGRINPYYKHTHLKQVLRSCIEVAGFLLHEDPTKCKLEDSAKRKRENSGIELPFNKLEEIEGYETLEIVYGNLDDYNFVIYVLELNRHKISENDYVEAIRAVTSKKAKISGENPLNDVVPNKEDDALGKDNETGSPDKDVEMVDSEKTISEEPEIDEPMEENEDYNAGTSSLKANIDVIIIDDDNEDENEKQVSKNETESQNEGVDVEMAIFDENETNEMIEEMKANNDEIMFVHPESQVEVSKNETETQNEGVDEMAEIEKAISEEIETTEMIEAMKANDDDDDILIFIHPSHEGETQETNGEKEDYNTVVRSLNAHDDDEIFGDIIADIDNNNKDARIFEELKTAKQIEEEAKNKQKKNKAKREDSTSSLQTEDMPIEMGTESIVFQPRGLVINDENDHGNRGGEC